VQRQSTQEIVGGIQIGFLVCSAGAMIVGLFLVYNAMAVTVTERRVDIGILRSLGATRGQIMTLFAVASAVLGLVGAALGVPLGWALGKLTLNQFHAELESMFLNPDVSPSRLSAETVALAMFAGVATAVFAALVPAIQAAADDPAHVVRRTTKGATGVWRLIHRAACLVLVGGGLTLILVRSELPPRVGSVGGMMVALVGLLLSAPVIVGALVRLVQPVARATCGIEIRLAFDNLTRAPGRTGVVIGALGAGVAMMFQTAGVGRSNEEPVVDWITQVVQADHFVFSGNMTTANSSNSPMADAVARDLAALPAVERVMAIRYARPEYNGTVVYLIALDAESYVRATRARVPSGMPGMEQFLDLPGTNDVLVSENFARRHKVAPGESITLPGPSGPVTLRVAGTVRDYTWSRGTIFMDRARYAKLFGDELVDICHVFLKPGRMADSFGARSVEAFAAEKGLFVADRDAIRKFLTELINRVYLLAYLQQIVVGVVAALGVVTALLISVLQRKRELGLLLAVGATPGQVLRSVLAEAILMGVFGTALGILIGLPMEWFVLKVVLVEESGFIFDVVFPWREALGIAAASILTATVAGLIPAVRAVRTQITDAIQYE
jgi:putative ABC transport system permease protein